MREKFPFRVVEDDDYDRRWCRAEFEDDLAAVLYLFYVQIVWFTKAGCISTIMFDYRHGIVFWVVW